MSGVVPANVAMVGSAPCSSNRRMTVTSPASAARRNGVWPVKSTHDSEPSGVDEAPLGRILARARVGIGAAREQQRDEIQRRCAVDAVVALRGR